MLKGIEHEPKSNGLGRRRGLKNQSNLDASTHRKSMTKLMDFEIKILENREKTVPKTILFSITFLNQFRMGLGRVWGPFGKGLVRSGASLGRSWAPLGRFGGVQNRVFFKQWSKLVSKRPLGVILEGLGEDLGRVSGGLARVWGGSWGASWPLWEAWS